MVVDKKLRKQRWPVRPTEETMALESLRLEAIDRLKGSARRPDDPLRDLHRSAGKFRQNTQGDDIGFYPRLSRTERERVDA